MRSEVVACRTIFPLGTILPTVYDTCMDNHTHTYPSKDAPDQDVSDPQTPLVSEMLPAFLDYLRVEEHHTITTLIRYESHLQKFITMVGDCPITQINSENLSLFNLYSALCTEGSVRSALSNTLTVDQLHYPVCAAAPTGTGSPGLALNHVGGTRGATRWTLSSPIDATLTS
jgi:hypothetical protein